MHTPRSGDLIIARPFKAGKRAGESLRRVATVDNWIHPEFQRRVWAYLGGMARRQEKQGIQYNERPCGDEREDHSNVATRRTALNFSPNRALKGPATVAGPLRGPLPRSECTNSSGRPSFPRRGAPYGLQRVLEFSQ